MPARWIVILSLLLSLCWAFPAAAEPLDQSVTTDWHLTADTHVPGNLLLQSGSIWLNGYTLKVAGNLFQYDGSLQVGSGRVMVQGEIQVLGGSLVMQDAAGFVQANGPFTMQSAVDHTGLLTAGTLEVRSDFFQYGGHPANFNAGGNHQVRLGGDLAQYIHFDTPNSSGFAVLDLATSPDAALYFAPELVAQRVVGGGPSRLIYSDSLAKSRPLEVSSSLAVAPHTTGEPITLGPMDITINAPQLLLMTETYHTGGLLQLNHHLLGVAGHLIQSSGTIDTGTGQLLVNGDYRLQYDSVLKMQQPAARVEVTGQFVTASTVDHTGFLTDGRLTVAGDFSQIGTHPANFAATGNHTTLLHNGPYAAQFETPATSHFGQLVLTRGTAGVRIFLPEIAANTVTSDSGAATISVGQLGGAQSLTIAADLTISPVNVGPIPMSSGQVTVRGHQVTLQTGLQLSGGAISLQEGATLAVTGDLLQQGGDLDVGGGAVLISGGYHLQNTAGLTMLEQGGLLVITGDFSTQSTVDHTGRLSAGVISLAGNFTQTGEVANFVAEGSHTLQLSGAGAQSLSFSSTLTRINTLRIGNCNAILPTGEPIWVSQIDDCTQPPALISSHPGYQSFGGTPPGQIHLLFTRPVHPGTTFAEISLIDTYGALISYTHSLAGPLLTLHPSARLQAPNYLLTIPDGALLDDANTALGGTGAISFFTSSQHLTYDWRLGQNETVDSLYLDSGLLDLGGHMLTVKGDLIQSGGTLQIGNGTLIVLGDYHLQGAATLQMIDPLGRVQVEGNFTTESSIAHSGLLTAGILEVAGDFTQFATDPQNFAASDGHQVWLRGWAAQRVSFESPGTSSFAQLEIRHSSFDVIQFFPEINAQHLYGAAGLLDIITPELTRHTPLTLHQDLRVKPPSGSASEIRLAGGQVDLNGHTLLVASNLTQPDGLLIIGGGKLFVEGHYQLVAPVPDTDASKNMVTASPGRLQMTHPDDYILVGGSFVTMSSQDHTGYLTAGILAVSGDFLQWAGHPTNFAALSEHQVRLSGSGSQTVSFDTPGASSFARLEIANPLPGGIRFRQSLNAHTVYSPLPAPTVTANGLTDTLPLTLASNLTVLAENPQHPIHLRGGALHLAGHELRLMYGSLLQEGGLLNLDGGQLIIQGDYHLTGSSLLQMITPTALLRVEGNMLVEHTTDQIGYLMAGRIEVTGNFTQRAMHPQNFATSADHRVILAGQSPQIISFESPGSSRFTHLELANPTPGGLSFTPEINAHHLYSPSGQAEVSVANLTSLTSTTLHLDLVAVPSFGGYVVELGGAGIALNGYQLRIKGDLSQSGGLLQVDRGVLFVDGHYHLQGDALLQMGFASDLVVVAGDFETASQQDHTGYLLAGLLEVGGNFVQRAGHPSNFATAPGGGHTVRLRSSKEQMVSFMNPGTSHFERVEVLNPRVSFDPEINTRYLLGPSNGLQIQTRALASQTPFSLSTPLTVSPLAGETAVLLLGQMVDLQGQSLMIHGDLLQAGGTLHIGGGTLWIDGDYQISGEGALQMVSPGDWVAVRGHMGTQSLIDHTPFLTSGRLDIGGDLTQGAGHPANFVTTGQHIVRLIGTNPQHLSFSAAPTSQLMTLQVANCLPDGVIDVEGMAPWQGRIDLCAMAPAYEALDLPASGHFLRLSLSRMVRPGPFLAKARLTTPSDTLGLRAQMQGATLLLVPEEPLMPDTTYTLTLPAGALIDPLDQKPLPSFSQKFTTPIAPGTGIRLLHHLSAADTATALTYQLHSNLLILSGTAPDDLVAMDSEFVLTPLATLPTHSAELLLSIRSSACQVQWNPGDLYMAGREPGMIHYRSADGQTATTAWRVLPSEQGRVTGLAQDLDCNFGGGLIAVTESGGVWQIHPTEPPVQILSTGLPLHGAIVMPINPDLYGPLSGKIVSGSGGLIYGMDQVGLTAYNMGGGGYDFALVEPGAHLFGLSGLDGLQVIPASAFVGWEGGLLIANQRPGTLLYVRWNAGDGYFMTEQLADHVWWQDITFAAMPLPRFGATLPVSAVAQGGFDPDLTQVTLSDGMRFFTRYAGEGGSFTFPEVPDGYYVLTITTPHHLSKQVSVEIADRRIVAPTDAMAFSLLFGDIDGNGQIDRSDLTTLVSRYAKQAGAEDIFFSLFDVVADGRIDLLDLVQLSRNVGVSQ